MPFVYNADANQVYSSDATPATEDAWMVLRQASNRNFSLSAVYAWGRAAAATSLTSIAHHVRRWTTAGSGGTAVTPSPRRTGRAAVTTVVDKQTAITPGTVDGSIQLGFGHSVTSQGQWIARDRDEEIHVEGGSGDELDVYSISGGASQIFSGAVEFSE